MPPVLPPAFRWSLVVAGESLLVLFLLTWGNSFTGSIPLHRAQLAILAVLGGIGWLAILQRPSRLPTLLIIAPLPLLASLVITSIASAYPSLSWFATWQCAAYVGIAWLLAMQASHPVGRRNLIAVMGIVVTIVIGFYLAEVALVWAEWLSLGFPITTLPLRPLGDGGIVQIPTWLGDVIALCAPVVVASLWIRHARTLAVALAVAAMVAIVLSGTRSVLLLVVVLSIVAAAVLLRDRANRRVTLAVSILATGVVVIGLGVILLTGRSFDEGRSSAFASAIDRFTSSPFVGTGPGTYGVYRMGDPVDSLSHLAFPDAVNIVLTSAAESGLVGLLGLACAVGLYALAIRNTWGRTGAERLTIVTAVLGLGVVGGHAMVEVVFALVGIVLLVLAALSLAAADTIRAEVMAPGRARPLDAVLVAGVVCILLSSTVLIRNEMTLDALDEVDRSMANSPADALAAARRGTDSSPDSVPAWWSRMVAADAAGDGADAVRSAQRTVDLEGFGQEILSLAVLMERNGDAANAREAVAHATDRLPLDPLVELNAAILHASAGAEQEAIDDIRQLLTLQPDIEPILVEGLPVLEPIIARAKSQVVADLMAQGNFEAAIRIALAGEDRELAEELVAGVAEGQDVVAATYWKAVVQAWFGDKAARTALDVAATARPTAYNLSWAWRLASHACDRAGTEHWERAAEIGAGLRPSTPTALGEAPSFQVKQLPSRYPGVVWRIDYPDRPYVRGIWSYEVGRPACVE
jgi:O-antigen ligase